MWTARLSKAHDPLALELVRYTVAGGLASLVDVSLLVVLTRGMGVYYLHAAAIAFGLGLLTSYLLSIAWVFHARTFQNPCVEVGLPVADVQKTALIGFRGLRLPCCLRIFTHFSRH